MRVEDAERVAGEFLSDGFARESVFGELDFRRLFVFAGEGERCGDVGGCGEDGCWDEDKEKKDSSCKTHIQSTYNPIGGMKIRPRR